MPIPRDNPPTLWYTPAAPVTYKFVFDPHVHAVLPLSVHPERPSARRRPGRRVELALLTLAVAASILAFTMLRASLRPAPDGPATTPIGASMASASR